MLPLVTSDSLSDIATTIGVVAVAWVYGLQAWSRRRARRDHAEVALTGSGSWRGTVELETVAQFHETRIGVLRGLMLDSGVPVRVEVSPIGLTVTLTSRLLRNRTGLSWTAPWSDVVGAATGSAGHKSYGGKWSTVLLTDVHVTLVGPSARRFLEHWELVPAPEDDEETSPEDQADWTPEDEADWQEFVAESLGPGWTPGTALWTMRTSAPDGLVEAITRWARGALPS